MSFILLHIRKHNSLQWKIFCKGHQFASQHLFLLAGIAKLSTFKMQILKQDQKTKILYHISNPYFWFPDYIISINLSMCVENGPCYIGIKHLPAPLSSSRHLLAARRTGTYFIKKKELGIQLKAVSFVQYANNIQKPVLNLYYRRRKY